MEHERSPTDTLTDAVTPMTSARVLNAYVKEAKYALLRFWRVPIFLIPTLIFPVFFYFLIGSVFGAFEAKSDEIDIATYMFCGFATLGAITPGIFAFGVSLATDRESGLFTLKRALPMPPLASLLASIVMSMISTFLAATLLAIAASVLQSIQLSIAQLVSVIAVVTVGAIPFCALGLLVGSFVTGRATPIVANVIYLLLIYFSGLIMLLPKSIQLIVVISPAFYLHQLALAAAHTKNFMIGGAATHVAILLIITLCCLGLATRRLVRVG